MRAFLRHLLLGLMSAGALAAGCSQQTSPVARNPSTPRVETFNDAFFAARGDEAFRIASLEKGCLLKWVHRRELREPLVRDWLAELGLERASAGPIATPSLPDLRLVLESGGRSRLICWPSDLRGAVSIYSIDDAVTFLRLFSSPGTFYHFPAYGFMGIEPGSGQPEPGKLDRQVLQNFQLPAMRVNATADGFVILRTAAQVDIRSWTVTRLVILQEHVGKDGSYSVLVLADEPLPEDAMLLLPLIM